MLVLVTPAVRFVAASIVYSKTIENSKTVEDLDRFSVVLREKQQPRDPVLMVT